MNKQLQPETAPQNSIINAEQEALLWQQAQRSGVDRRRFLYLLSAGGASAVLAVCNSVAQTAQAATPTPATTTAQSGPLATPAAAGTPTVAATTKASPWFKDTTPFIKQGDTVLETRLENLDGFITPTEDFFVRNHSVSVDVDPKSWRLVVEGDAITKPLSLTYQEILELPSRTVFSYLECAGNQRALFDLVKGKAAPGTQWKTGGVGNGEWTGVSVSEVLKLAGIKKNAVDVLFIGLDKASPEEGLRRALPVEKALDPDTLLAYALNGAPLPKDHGFPLRTLAPGWVGASSIKWLGRIVVSAQKIWTRNNTTAYVLVGDEYPPEGKAPGKPLTTQVIKSELALPWPATLAAGAHRLHGYAHSPAGHIKQVEWSSDNGKTWNAATVLDPQIQYSWARFEFTWDAKPGKQTILTRATDVAGNTQPKEIPFNRDGYLFNQPVPHPITVT